MTTARFSFLFYRVFFPVALFFFHALYWFLPKKMQEMIDDRKKPWVPLSSRPILIHASSGEVEYAKSVMRELKKEYPQIPLLVTYSSPSAKKLIQGSAEIDLALPLPWDKKGQVQAFLQFFKPRLALFARTDVWPELSYQLKENKIPSLLFSATFASSKIPAIRQFSLQNLNEIFCVSEMDKNNLAPLNLKNKIQVAGDTRYDQVLYRLGHPRAVRKELKPGGDEFIFIAGSTWPEDEAILLEALKDFKGRVILAPHETDAAHIEKLAEQLKTKNFSYDIYTKCSQWREQFLIVDQVGCLQELYTWAQVAFVGGSFKEKVHSVMEPLCTGLPVIVGPFHLNNREATQFQKLSVSPNFFAVNCVNNSQEFRETLAGLQQIKTAKQNILTSITQHNGASQKVGFWAQSQLKQN